MFRHDIAANLPHLAPSVVSTGERPNKSSAGEAVATKALPSTAETRARNMIANKGIVTEGVEFPPGCLNTSAHRSKIADNAGDKISQYLRNA